MDFGVSATKVEVSIARCNAVISRLGFIVAHIAPILYQLVSLQRCHPIHGRTIALVVECRLLTQHWLACVACAVTTVRPGTDREWASGSPSYCVALVSFISRRLYCRAKKIS